MSKILIIDDELEICKQVSLILKKNEFNTSYVTSYDEFKKLNENLCFLKELCKKHMFSFSFLSFMSREVPEYCVFI